MGEYDRTMKLLVDSNPEAMARFVLHEWQRQKHTVLPEVTITSVAELSAEFQSEELDGDNVLLVEGPDGPLYLLEVEFQSRLHSFMPLRSLEYCARAKKKHWNTYGDLPILAAVIYLFDDEGVPEPPLRWVAPDGETVLYFSYLSIKLKALPREELLALQQPALWPLVLLTEGQVDRIIVGEMFTELIDQKRYNVLPMVHTIAAWMLSGDDLTWLHQEYDAMQELFRESPALQWMEESATKRVEARITERVTEQVRQEEREKAKQRLLKANQKTLEERKKAAEERKKMLAAFRQSAIELVSQRFPSLLWMAKAQVRLINQPDRFPQIMLRLAQARTIEETQQVLLSLDEDEDEQDEPEANG